VNRKTLLRRTAVAATTLATLTTLSASAYAQSGNPGGALPNGPAGGPWQQMAQIHHGQGMQGMQGMHQKMRHMRRGGGMVEHLLANASEVGLTDAQQDQLRQVRRRAPGLLMPKKQALVEAQMDLHDVMDKNKADSAELRRANDKVLKSRSDLAAAVFDLRMQVRDVLTPEQRSKIHSAMREHLRGGGAPGMKMPGGPGGGHGDEFDSGDDSDDDGDGSEF